MALWLMWIPEAGSVREERVAFLQIPRGYISLFIIIIPLSTPYYAWHVVHSPAAYLPGCCALVAATILHSSHLTLASCLSYSCLKIHHYVTVICHYVS